jgi:simple sugar transport system ATP-binding protein
MTTALALRGIDKRFGSTRALEAASCSVRTGTVHALLGENGAGKTTLMRIAFGIERPDAGSLELHGVEARFRTSADAIAAGVGMVHQHFMLVPAVTVAENIALGGHGRFDARQTAARVEEIGRDTGLRLDPSQMVRDLSVGAQQRLEIVKALAHDARLLILDEPTGVLTPDETAELYAWLRRFASQGGTVVLITHKLREALDIADDVTVLRQGRTILEASTGEVTEAQVIAALVGERDATEDPTVATPPRRAHGTRTASASDAARSESRSASDGAAVLALHAAHYRDANGIDRLTDVSLEVRAGEVLGVLGVEGAGQRELLRLLAGRLEPTSGTVTRPERVGFIPEDRLHDALIPSFTLTENFALAGAGQRRGLLDWRGFQRSTGEAIAAMDVRAAGETAPAWTLSGGNQQKFVVARERAASMQALVVENPTRGLDIRATARVREEIAARAGDPPAAVVYYSSDIDEVLAVATRVVVCYSGRVHEVSPSADPADTTPFTRALMGAF